MANKTAYEAEVIKLRPCAASSNIYGEPNDQIQFCVVSEVVFVPDVSARERVSSKGNHACSC